MDEIKVSILCLTYNHEKYIQNALEGFVMQKTNFKFEVLVHDDASTDKTADIVREYEAKYPDIIKPLYQAENQYSKGVKISKVYQYPRARGKYLAWCEGDDCWTDPLKLQKQIDFLDNHSDYSMCVHRVRVNDIRTNTEAYIPVINSDRDYSVDEIIRSGTIFQLSSVVFRKELFMQKPECFDARGFGDIQLYIYGAICGKVRAMCDVMSTYNHGTASSWTVNVARNREKSILHSKEKLRMLKAVNEYYNYEYDKSLSYMIKRTEFNIAYEEKNKKELRRPEYKDFLKQRKMTEVKDFLRKHFPFLAKIKNSLNKLRR